MAARPRGGSASFGRPSISFGTSGGDDQAYPPLKLGDEILFLSHERRGFVFSDVSSQVVQSVSAYSVVHPFSVEDPNLPDTEAACFRVLAANKYQAQQTLLSLKQQLADSKKITRHERELQRVAEANFQSETTENSVEQERVSGNSVTYGTAVQLQHVYTGKYLSVNPTITSALGNTNLRIELCSENSQNCIFQILPRYKVRSVGDEVLINDQVIFESVETKGQYFHCSRRTLGAIGIHLHSKNYEVNLSGTESSFTVVAHRQAKEAALLPGTVWAGGVFRLFHREIECYLAAEGSFAKVGAVGPEVTKDVHLRKRPSERGQLKAPSTSAITYWRIEKQRNPITGEAMQWGELCRIRHLVTRQYLSLESTKEGVKICLRKYDRSKESEAAVTFRLRPVVQGEEKVTYGSFARFYHPKSDTWLHAKKDTSKDGGDLFRLSAESDMSYVDAFALLEVKPDLVKQFNMVAGMMPVFEAYLDERLEGRTKLNQAKASIVEKALKELADYMKDPFAPRMKDRQKLLRNLRLVDLLIEILKLYNPKAADARLQRQVCIAVYNVIEVFLVGQSRKNELYLSQFIPFFETHIGLGLDTESMLIELVRDNIQIVSTYQEEEMRRMIDTLLAGEEKDSRFLTYLGVLCVVDDKASVANQDFILEELVIKHGEELFWPTKVKEDKNGEKRIVYQNRETGVWSPLSEIGHKGAAKKDLAFTKSWRWLEAQLDLFGKLAKGNNKKVIRALAEDLKYITFDEALAGASDSDLHPTIRSKYVALIIGLFVDVGNNRSVLETLPNTFVYSELVENPFAAHEAEEDLALTGEKNPHFPQLRDWILSVIISNSRLVCREDHKEYNGLIAQIMTVLELLVKFGYYDNNDDIRRATGGLLSMLDGTNDIHSPKISEEEFRLKKRFKDTPRNRPVFNIKVKIMHVLDFFFNYRVFLRLQRFIFSYRCLTGDLDSALTGRGGRSSRHDRSHAVYLDVEPTGLDDGTKPLLSAQRKSRRATTKRSQGPPRELRALLDPQATEIHHLRSVASSYLYETLQQTAFFEHDVDTARNEILIKVLLDLSKYEDDNILLWSYQLLNRYFSSASDIFQRAVDAQLLLTAESAQAREVAVSKGNELRRLIQHELDSESIGKLEAVLRQLTELCTMDEALKRSHCQNQRIILNHRILPTVLDLILHRFDDYKFDESEDADPSRDSVESLFRVAFKFLTVFAREHRAVQEQLFVRLDSLLAVPFARANMAAVVEEVFTDHHELCLKLKETHVERIFTLLVTSTDPNEQGALLQALKAMTITRVDDIDLPIKRNQDFIMKYFSRNKDFFKYFLGDEGHETANRMELLTSTASNPGLVLLLNIMDLLSTSCKGRNIFVQSICQNVMPVDEVLKVLNSATVSAVRKQPFLSYLVWVYLDQGSSALLLQLSDEQMVKFLRTCYQFLLDMSKRLDGSARDAPLAVEALRYSCLGDQIDTEEWLTTGRLNPEIGSLTYLLSGLLPFIRVYYWQLTRCVSECTNIMDLLRHVTSALLACVPSLPQYLKNKKEFLVLREAVLSSTCLPEIDNYLNLPAKLREIVNTFIDEAPTMRSDPIKAFESIYSEELKLNVAFNNYVKAFEEVYNGPNTLQSQIGVTNKPICAEPYSDFDDDRMEVKGPLYLPLGQAFQSFVSCFVVRNQKTPHVYPEAKYLVKLLHVAFTRMDELHEGQRNRLDGLVVKCLQVLRAMMHNEVARVDPELKESHPKRYNVVFANVVIVQDAVQTVGDNTVAKIIPMLTHQNANIVREVLAFLSVILYEGNRKAQRGCEFLCHRKEGRFLKGVERNLLLSVALTKENRMLLKQLVDKENENKELMLRNRGNGSELYASLEILPAGEQEVDSDQESIDTDDEEDEPWLKEGGDAIPLKKLSHKDKGAQVSRKKDTKESLLNHNPLNPEMALKVIGLMCNGQNRDLQNFFRRQPESILNVNLVASIASFLHQQHSEVTEQNIELLTETVQTLVELCVGNFYNQEVLFDSQIVDVFNRLLQLPHVKGCRVTQVMFLKAATLDLLHTFTEETHARSTELIHNVLKTLDLEVVLHSLVYFNKMRMNEIVKRDRAEDNAERTMLKTFQLVQAILSSDGLSEQYKQKLTPTVSDEPTKQEKQLQWCWKYCEARTRSVEINYTNLDGDNILSTYHFTYNPSDKLPEELVEKVKWTVSRDSGESKVRDFLEWTKAVKREIEHTNILRSRWYTNVFIAYPQLWHWAYILLSLLLNILVLASWNDPADLTQENAGLYSPRTVAAANASTMLSPTVPLVYWWFGSVLLFILGGIHVLVTLKLILAYFLVNWSNFYIIPSFSFSVCGKSLSHERDESYTDVFVFGWKTLYFVTLLCCSGLSLAFWGYFYPICLLHIIVNNDILQRVLRSVTKNWKSLLWTLCLGLVLLYIYGTIAYAAYQAYFDDPGSGSHCRTLFQCVISAVRLGPIMGGGLVTNADGAFVDGGAFIGNFPLYIPRTVLDVSFFIIVTTIGLGVIFGIIVDNFSELRDERHQAEADKNDFCFICNHPSYEFERRAQGFKPHVERDHNMWNYIYLSLWLDRVHVNEQSATELHVAALIKQDSPAFFPLHKAKCLKSEVDETGAKLEHLMTNVQTIIDRFKKEEKVLAKQMLLEEQEQWELQQDVYTSL